MKARSLCAAAHVFRVEAVSAFKVMECPRVTTATEIPFMQWANVAWILLRPVSSWCQPNELAAFQGQLCDALWRCMFFTRFSRYGATHILERQTPKQEPTLNRPSRQRSMTQLVNRLALVTLKLGLPHPPTWHSHLRPSWEAWDRRVRSVSWGDGQCGTSTHDHALCPSVYGLLEVSRQHQREGIQAVDVHLWVDLQYSLPMTISRTRAELQRACDMHCTVSLSPAFGNETIVLPQTMKHIDQRKQEKHFQFFHVLFHFVFSCSL